VPFIPIMFMSFIHFGPGADLIGIVQPVLGLALRSGAMLHMPNPQREKGADLRREEHSVPQRCRNARCDAGARHRADYVGCGALE